MKIVYILLVAAAAVVCLWPIARQAQAAESEPRGDSWTKTLKERSQRGSLHDALQNVRGDSGKWNDEPQLTLAPPVASKPEGVSLDDWFDQLLEKKAQLKSGDNVGLLFRTRQLDDNDRVWVERIERRGNRFTVEVSQAIWQGRYNKTFTYYDVLGVNLGKLEPGEYQATWIIKPLVFNKFEDPGAPRDNWPKDERGAADEKPVELRAEFTVAGE